MKTQNNNYELIRAGFGIEPIPIIYEDNHLLAVIKPAGLPAQEDHTGRPDLLNILKGYLKQKYDKPGNVWLGLLHRLDQPVSGIMLFAKTSKAASRLSAQIRDHLWQKYYLAVVEGLVEGRGIWEDRLSAQKRQGKIVADKEGKLCKLEFESLIQSAELQQSLLKIKLLTGRRHQIRVQAQLRNHPLIGDYLYGSGSKSPAAAPALFAYKLGVIHPISQEELVLLANPASYLADTYPFTNFILDDIS